MSYMISFASLDPLHTFFSKLTWLMLDTAEVSSNIFAANIYSSCDLTIEEFTYIELSGVISSCE